MLYLYSCIICETFFPSVSVHLFCVFFDLGQFAGVNFVSVLIYSLFLTVLLCVEPDANAAQSLTHSCVNSQWLVYSVKL